MANYERTIKQIDTLTEKLNSAEVPDHIKEKIKQKIEEIILELSMSLGDSSE